MNIDAGGPFGPRPDTISPIVKVGETAAGPADHRDMDFFQRLHHIRPIAVDIGNLTALANPNAAIDAGSQMLAELAIDMTIDLRARLAGIDRHGRDRRLGASRRGER